MSLRYAFLAILLIAVCAGSPARAFNFVSYVSNSGNDANSCNQTSPCQTIPGAINKTFLGGVVSCITSPLDTTAVLTFSITIDCSGVNFAIVHGGIGITIQLDPSDALQTVRLRGFTIKSFQGLGSRGVEIDAAGTVILQDMNIEQEAQQGVIDLRTGGQTRLYVTDSTIHNCGGPGIVAAAAAPGIVVLDNVRSENNLFGLAVATGNNVTVSRSVLSGNSVAGVIGDPGSQIIVDNSTISHNGAGVLSSSSVRLSNNNIAFNAIAISGVSGSFGNNRFSGNTSAGTAPTPLGAASSDIGQQ